MTEPPFPHGELDPVPEFNPYTPPQAFQSAKPDPQRPPSNANLREIREEFLVMESRVRFVSTLTLIAGYVSLVMGAVLLLLGIIILFTDASPGFAALEPVVGIVVGVFYLLFGGLQYWVAGGLRNYRNWARVTYLLCMSGTLCYSVFHLLHGEFILVIQLACLTAIFWILANRMTRSMFTQSYRQLIDATSDMQPIWSNQMTVFSAIVTFAILIAASVVHQLF